MNIFLVGFLGLFLELAFIRWMPANVFALAYFSNTILISSFLGLGLGFLLAGRKREVFHWFPLCLLVVVGASLLFRMVFVFMVPPTSDLLWNFFYVDSWLEPLTIRLGFLPTLSIVFVLSATPFVFIGQQAALFMAQVKPLKAYGLDVLGSLAGVVVFAVLSLIGGKWGTPLVWFMGAGVISLWFLRHQWRHLLFGGLCVVALGVMLFFTTNKENWSPYYSINVVYKLDVSESRIYVNRFLHQIVIDFKKNEFSRNKYALAYTLKKPKKDLVLGAGTGNDVATAETNGAEEIRAVELDPVIAEIGKEVRLDNVFKDPRLELSIGDARSFLKRTKEAYDMIVFGTLDSHALLSGLSTVRVENFVYTVESFEEAKKHLTKDGVVVVMYSAPQQWLGDKLIKTVATALPDPKPLVYADNDGSFLYNLMIIAGPGVNSIPKEKYTAAGFHQITGSSVSPRDIPTDDWPYLYLLKHTIPAHYISAIVILLLLSFAGIYGVAGKDVTQWGTWSNLTLFCLGAAFLVLETKSVTSLSLMFGSTWLVNASVFGGMLLTVLCANMFAGKISHPRISIVYIALGVMLALNYLISASAFLALSSGLRFIIPALLAASPLFFASLAFSFHIKSAKNMGAALGVNLMGAVFGGFLEYTSMLTGLRFLYILAGLLYLIAFWGFLKTHATSNAGEIQT